MPCCYSWTAYKPLVLDVLVIEVVVFVHVVLDVLEVEVLLWVVLVVVVTLTVVVLVPHSAAGTWLIKIPPVVRQIAWMSLLFHASFVVVLPPGTYAQYGRAWLTIPRTGSRILMTLRICEGHIQLRDPNLTEDDSNVTSANTMASKKKNIAVILGR